MPSSLQCDEEKPSCRNCEKKDSPCSFLQYVPLARQSRHYQQTQKRDQPIQNNSRPMPSPTTGLSGFPLLFTIIDLELFHYYTTMTSHEILGPHITGTNSWHQSSVISLSFKHPFLLHQLLSLAALHLVFLHSSNPVLGQKFTHMAAIHHAKCIAGFRSQVQDITNKNSVRNFESGLSLLV